MTCRRQAWSLGSPWTTIWVEDEDEDEDEGKHEDQRKQRSNEGKHEGKHEDEDESSESSESSGRLKFVGMKERIRVVKILFRRSVQKGMALIAIEASVHSKVLKTPVFLLDQ
mmetsp:Transcript_81651/g.149197  ORF Transcript_81651/g.149197 Transcript_81651/m.149197 type:complete len:112 (+) Transcript_81651:288-623(+)